MRGCRSPFSRRTSGLSSGCAAITAFPYRLPPAITDSAFAIENPLDFAVPSWQAAQFAWRIGRTESRNMSGAPAALTGKPVVTTSPIRAIPKSMRGSALTTVIPPMC